MSGVSYNKKSKKEKRKVKDVFVEHYGRLVGKTVTKIAKEADRELYGLIFIVAYNSMTEQ